MLDVDVTTNRPDAMNHFGLAREVAAIYGLPLRRPAAAPVETAERTADAIRVIVEDAEGCPRFAARVVRDVRVGPSPEWLRKRLDAIGLRSINNVVDVTNFILWELGQPLHAYDLAKLGGTPVPGIVARRARAGERLTTLDGVERELDPEILVIADGADGGGRPVGLAGVMGGLDSEVTDATRDLLIEGAHFDRRRVRLAAKRFGLHTDASHRFERGADPEICAEAVGRAAALIAQVAGGTVLAGVIDVRDPGRSWHRHGHLDPARLDAFAGARIPADDAERWLAGLGFGIDRSEQTASWRITVPSWRYFDFQPRPEPPHDVYPQDLYEEVIRMYGFDNIAAALPGIPGADAPKPPYQVRRERARRQLAASGYVETVHFAFLDPARDAAFPSLRPEAKPMRLANPLSEQYSVLRRSLAPNLVETARFNQRRGLAAVRMFEIATVFYALAPGRDPGPAGARRAGLRRPGGEPLAARGRARPLRPQGDARGAGRRLRRRAWRSARRSCRDCSPATRPSCCGTAGWWAISAGWRRRRGTRSTWPSWPPGRWRAATRASRSPSRRAIPGSRPTSRSPTPWRPPGRRSTARSGELAPPDLDVLGAQGALPRAGGARGGGQHDDLVPLQRARALAHSR